MIIILYWLGITWPLKLVLWQLYCIGFMYKADTCMYIFVFILQGSFRCQTCPNIQYQCLIMLLLILKQSQWIRTSLPTSYLFYTSTDIQPFFRLPVHLHSQTYLLSKNLWASSLGMLSVGGFLYDSKALFLLSRLCDSPPLPGSLGKTMQHKHYQSFSNMDFAPWCGDRDRSCLIYTCINIEGQGIAYSRT